jgi:CubicO group peptidase (beta-lactamase class C family)
MAVRSSKTSGHSRRLALILSLTILVSCKAGVELGYIHADEPIGTVREVYDGALFPDIQVNTFRNIDRLFPSRVVRRGTYVYPLTLSDTPLENFRFSSRGQEYDLYDFVSLNRVSGLLVIRNGKIVFEKYFLGNSEETHWMSMSVVKSMTATLVGAAIKDGYIKSIDDQVTDYLPRFRGSAYEGVTLRNLLQMASGVAWNETYTDPKSDRRRMLDAQIGQKPGAILDLMAGLGRAAEPGTRWNYSTGETHVVGALVRAATGMPVAEYLSEKIWAPFGMEADASWWLESPDGLEVGGSGLSARLRDYGRFGLFLLNDGVINGEAVLPEGWVRQASTPKVINGENVEYGYMLWPLGDDTYAAIGIFGQFVYVNPHKDLVVAMWGAQSKPVGRDVVDEYEFFAALSAAVP